MFKEIENLTYLAIFVGIHFSDNFVDHFIAKLFTHGGHKIPKFVGGDETVTISVENPKRFSDHF